MNKKLQVTEESCLTKELEKEPLQPPEICFFYPLALLPEGFYRI